LKENVEDLVDRSSKGESNPTVLDHGKADIKKLKNCDYDSQNIHWTGSEWKCQDVDLLSDCIAAADEYRVDKGDGSYSCQKYAKNSTVDYYWDFTGYSVQCNSSTGKHTNIYGCFYKNKQNKAIQVDLSHCSGKSKKAVSVKTCTSTWVTSEWGACSKACGGGVQSRTVTCPAGKVCLSAKPVVQQACNTHVCTTSWKVSSWSRCSKTCGGGTQSRTVTCPNGFVCSGNKPSTSQVCNTQSCTICKYDGSNYIEEEYARDYYNGTVAKWGGKTIQVIGPADPYKPLPAGYKKGALKKSNTTSKYGIYRYEICKIN
ncbi:MAG: hypothetical protein CFH44_00667, partial [Proteobacteria bacterium]